MGWISRVVKYDIYPKGMSAVLPKNRLARLFLQRHRIIIDILIHKMQVKINRNILKAFWSSIFATLLPLHLQVCNTRYLAIESSPSCRDQIYLAMKTGWISRAVQYDI